MSNTDSKGSAGGESLLVAIDDSEAAGRALAYVGRVLGSRPGFRVLVYHRLPELPPRLREHGGSSDPERETELGRELARLIAEWVSGLEVRLEPIMRKSHAVLREAEVPDSAIELLLDRDVFPGESLCDALIRVARQRGCHTIAVSREHVHGIEGIDELLRRHTGDRLVRTGEGLAVWVIE
ncbi:MAG TPA: hypothetical protein VFA95_09270 [Gammaproteobacteria bacterium]|nr:hypothetical protein [Gammaproteobacteria bacterium]